MPNLTATPEGWKLFLRSVRENFPGKSNKSLRAIIRKAADDGESLMRLSRHIAFTGSGLAGLRDCDQQLAHWDGRAARDQTNSTYATNF